MFPGIWWIPYFKTVLLNLLICNLSFKLEVLPIEKQEFLKNLIDSAKELAEDMENLKKLEELERTVEDGFG